MLTRVVARFSELPFDVIFPIVGLVWISQMCLNNIFWNLSWKRSDYLLGIIDVKIPWCETKSIIFFLHAFSCKQRCRRHHEWYSSLWQKVVKKGPIFSTFFPNTRRWEQDCKIPSWAQRCFKKSFFPLKNRTFQVRSKTTKTFNKGGYYNSFFFFFLLQHFKTQWQHFVLKISQCEIDYHKFNCWCNCFLCNLFEENKFETWNWFAKFYCCWYNLYIIWCN